MTRLIRAELRRVAARRLVRATLSFAALAIVVGGIIAFATSSSISEAQYQQRVQHAEAERKTQNEQARACLTAHGVKEGDDFSGRVARECIPEAAAVAHDPRFHRVRMEGVLKGVSGVLAIVGWALGASLVGAEFASRGMTTMLTWETRRTRVMVAKVAVVLVTALAFAALALVAVALAMLPAMTAHGAPFRPGEPTLASFAGIVGRGAVLCALAAGMGFGIATLGRNTAAALGAGFGYIIVLENILGSSLRSWRPWLLLGNAIVFVSGQSTSDVPHRSVAGAGLLLAAVAAALLLAAVGAFRARDVA